MVAAVIVLSAYALSVTALVVIHQLHRAIDKAIEDAFGSLTEDDLMCDYTLFAYPEYLRTSPYAEAEAKIKANVARQS
jgi:hypothetical protein